MNKAFLEDKSIYLRGLCEEDITGNYPGWFNDSEVCRFNSHHRFPYPAANAKDYIEKTFKSRSSLILAILTKDKDVHIGNISLQNIDNISRSAEFAIIIGEKEYWRKGYSKEAATLIIKHGFIELNLNRIYCGTSAKNNPMHKLADYLGMTLEGRRREALYKTGEYQDILEYGILRKEFLIKYNMSETSLYNLV